MTAFCRLHVFGIVELRMSWFHVSKLTLALIAIGLTHLACAQDWDELKPGVLVSNGSVTPSESTATAPEPTSLPLEASSPTPMGTSEVFAKTQDASMPAVRVPIPTGQGGSTDAAPPSAPASTVSSIPDASMVAPAPSEKDAAPPSNFGLDAQHAADGSMLPVCGDGIVQEGEECDEGGLSAQCTVQCTSRCGAGCQCEDHGSDHYHYCTLGMHWGEARDFCEANDSYLVRLNSILEFGWVDSARARFGVNQVFWIGLTLPEQSDTWVWSDGTPFSPMSPDNLWVDLWRPDEPNGSGRCGLVGRNPEGKLGIDDNGCTRRRRHFVCESRPPQ